MEPGFYEIDPRTDTLINCVNTSTVGIDEVWWVDLYEFNNDVVSMATKRTSEGR